MALRLGLVSLKIIFFKFCYLIQVEHEKCSEMCVWNVSVWNVCSKIEKLGLFLVKKVNIEKSAKKSLIHSLLIPTNQRGSVQKFWKFARLLSLIRLSEKQHEKSIWDNRFFWIGDFLRQLHLNSKIKSNKNSLV